MLGNSQSNAYSRLQLFFLPVSQTFKFRGLMLATAVRNHELSTTSIGQVASKKKKTQVPVQPATLQIIDTEGTAEEPAERQNAQVLGGKSGGGRCQRYHAGRLRLGHLVSNGLFVRRGSAPRGIHFTTFSPSTKHTPGSFSTTSNMSVVAFTAGSLGDILATAGLIIQVT